MRTPELMLISTSALLIFIKNGLLLQMPGANEDYRNIWDLYKSCSRFADLLCDITQYIEINDIELYPDIMQIVNRFISDLHEIADFVRLSSLEPEPTNFRDFIPTFRRDLENRIRGLYTTLCCKFTCPVCIPK